MPEPSTALCIVCHDRPKELRDLLDSAAGHSFDEIIVADMASSPPLQPQQSATTWFRVETNEGCPAGRNRLAEVSTSDVVMFVDDDAVLTGTSDHAAILRRFFVDHPTAAAATGLIRRADGHVERHEFPFPGEATNVLHSRRAGCVLGGCTAFRRIAFMEARGYDSSFFYSMEELDLSTRLHQAGWELWYLPDLSIEHRPSTSGRVADDRVITMGLRNRLVYCRRSLPWPAAVVHGVIWSLIIGRDACRLRTPDAWFTGVRSGTRDPVHRHPLSMHQAMELHRLGGRVWR